MKLASGLIDRNQQPALGGGKHLTGQILSHYFNSQDAYSQNLGLAWKRLPGTNTLAYCEN